MARRSRTCRALFTVFFFVSITHPAAADAAHRAVGRFQTLDAIEVLIHNDELLAIGRAAGAPVRERLELGEHPLYVDSRGNVAVVVTDKRVLAATADVSRWMWTYIGVHESLPDAVVLGDNVALVVTDKRIIGLAGDGVEKFFAQRVGPNENVRDFLVAENVALVVTDKRLLGMSAFLPGFFEQQVGIHERIEHVSALADFATVATHRRLLVFQAPTATWQERRLSLR